MRITVKWLGTTVPGFIPSPASPHEVIGIGRTVEDAIRRACNKLGAADRRQVARQARRILETQYFKRKLELVPPALVYEGERNAVHCVLLRLE